MPKVGRDRKRYHAKAAVSAEALVQKHVVIGSSSKQPSATMSGNSKLDKESKRRFRRDQLKNKLMLPGQAVNRFNAGIASKRRNNGLPPSSSSSSAASPFALRPEPLKLSSVSQALPTPKDMHDAMMRESMRNQQSSGVSLKTNAQKAEAKIIEANQMAAVLSHPEFDADPFSTMKQHIENSLAVEQSQQETQDWRVWSHVHDQKTTSISGAKQSRGGVKRRP